jgi:hypothetical protein
MGLNPTPETVEGEEHLCYGSKDLDPYSAANLCPTPETLQPLRRAEAAEEECSSAVP